jgi:hypothetical protein
MKPSMLGLLIAAGAFGASTIYLGVQLKDERAHADRVLEQSRQLSARIAELEKERSELESLRLAGGAAEIDVAMTHGRAPDVPPDVPAGNPDSRNIEPERVGSPGGPPLRSEAMQKMMRAQLRANIKRMHADIGEKLGLSKDDTNKLIDMMVDQQMAMMERSRQERGSNLTPEQRAAAFTEQQQKNQTDIIALIGADKAGEYQAYQDSMPARQEVDMLSRQLESNDAGLSKEQRDRMVSALSEERKRVPAPKFSESTSREDYDQAMSTWQEDYNQRAASRASSILTNDQQTAYTEYQQWNKEMRQQFEERRAARQNNGGRNPGAIPRQP